MTSDYIVPLFESKDLTSFIGTAFCIDNFLITAGHIVPHYRIYYTKDNRRFFEIYPENWIIRQHPKEDYPERDVAICKLEGLKSELSLSTSPLDDTEADVICWQKKGNSPIAFSTKGLVCRNSDENTNFYKLVTCDRITHGSSGCPILQGNKVVGMLTHGVDNPTFDPNDYPNASQDLINEILRNKQNTCRILRPEYIQKVLDSVNKDSWHRDN